MKVTKRRRSDAQRAAERRNDDRRRNAPRLPNGRLSEEEAELLDEATAYVGGTKKDALMAGLRALLAKRKDIGA